MKLELSDGGKLYSQCSGVDSSTTCNDSLTYTAISIYYNITEPLQMIYYTKIGLPNDVSWDAKFEIVEDVDVHEVEDCCRKK